MATHQSLLRNSGGRILEVCLAEKIRGVLVIVLRIHRPTRIRGQDASRGLSCSHRLRHGAGNNTVADEPSILLDIVQPRPSWASVAESLHSNILRFARQTSESHSQVWWNILEPMHKVWGNVKPAVGSALRTTCGQQAYLDLVEVIRPGLVAEAMAQPNLDGANTGDADEGDADRGDREGMGHEAKEDVAEAES